MTPNEDVEPRVIGRPGTTAIGLGGYADRITSEDDNLPLQPDAAGRRQPLPDEAHRGPGGVVGSGALGGDPDALPTGVGVPSLHAFAAATWYFTPQSMASFYAGAGYWAQITARDGADSGFDPRPGRDRGGALVARQRVRRGRLRHSA